MLERPISSEREDAIRELRAYIDDGGYHPGDRLPAERELMVSLGMGRTLLRRALEALEREGAIWRHVGKGTFVAASNSYAGAISELSQRISPVHMMRARLSLEPALAREAAINASDEAVIRLRLARERAEAAADWAAYEAQDDAFHRSVAEATGNALLLALFDQLNQVRRAVAWNTVVRRTERPPRDHSSFDEHARIANAIEARDPTAAHAAMRDHLGSVSARLFGEA
ncbi:FadR/GntR family transcriptional regulator [Defluviimonas sp. D31]|uniref:FadR/GntR family transcriptional regulator n=1 Tax=Defluviimonas sp. D31 TaxID=3083253 RepID=UPI00296F4695|nr:FCD domain-containing protein [Defluviimonas sp. D31]